MERKNRLFVISAISVISLLTIPRKPRSYCEV